MSNALFVTKITEGALHERSKIIDELEGAIRQEWVEPMIGDRWLLASALQKSIRRGESERALQAGLGLWLHDRRRFWDRLLVVALEDIGCGDPNVLVQVLAGISSTDLRRQKGDIYVGLHLTRLLCGTVKSRLVDAVFIQAEKSNRFHAVRQEFASASDQLLARCVRDKEIPLIERAIAVWLLAGTKRFRSEIMPPRVGDIGKAIAAVRATATPNMLTEACIGVTSRLPWPLALHITLIWQEVQRHKTTVQQYPIPVSPDVGGLPVCAADIFTRVGKASFRELQRAVPALKPFTAQQLGLGVFYLDGGLVDKELTAPGLDAIQNAGEIADLESAGLPPAAYGDLRHALRDSMELLNDIRQAHLRRHLTGLKSGEPK